MKDDIEKLAWAVSLSQKNIDELRAGALLTIKEDLLDFLNSGSARHHLSPSIAEAARVDFVEKISLGTLKAIQCNFRGFIGKIIEGEGENFWVGWASERLTRAAFAQNKMTPFQEAFIATNEVDLAQHALISLLVRAAILPAQIRRCPECQMIFLLNRKPDDRNFFCTPRCAMRAAHRKSRTHKNEEIRVKERLRNNRRYELKVRSKPHLAHAKIGRRAGKIPSEEG